MVSVSSRHHEDIFRSAAGAVSLTPEEQALAAPKVRKAVEKAVGDAASDASAYLKSTGGSGAKRFGAYMEAADNARRRPGDAATRLGEDVARSVVNWDANQILRQAVGAYIGEAARTAAQAVVVNAARAGNSSARGTGNAASTDTARLRRDDSKKGKGWGWGR
ncbi:hypothetical protein PWY87_04735 [Kribbella solani]|uniref:hypothetical protein n=1 Tax=Kribbella solani TaxID=236067 RepID=UPI0029BAECD7|nr:hypothetical protein [Kribbella solani]MDX2971481.1 hypothetical protein [Kribbella solani]MDX3000964.1 hypothetical protein [Kribbella solani]